MSTTARDSGAGAYSKGDISLVPRSVGARSRGRSVQAGGVVGDVVAAGVGAGSHPLALEDEVVEQARRAEAEPVVVEPRLARDLVDAHEELDGVLARADAARRLHADHLAGRLEPVT